MSLHEHRTQVRRLLDDSSPADAPTAYYALFLNPARSVLYTYSNNVGEISGFVGVFQTGIDLFRPLVTLQCDGNDCAIDLLARALTPERPYIFFAKMSQLPLVGDLFHFDDHRILNIYRLDPRRFTPEINILVEHKTAHDGTPRAVIGASGEAQAIAGLNWQSPAFAELYDWLADSLHHYLLTETGSAEDAADLLQETFARLYRARKQLESVNQMKAYVFQTARNEARRWQSRRQTVCGTT